MDSERRKAELIIELERQRTALDRSRSGLRKKLSLSHQLKRSVQENPRSWFLGSLGTATLAGMLFRRPRVVIKGAKTVGVPRFGRENGLLRRASRLVCLAHLKSKIRA